jgi:imidazolonepropionase-like amidohydrolase
VHVFDGLGDGVSDRTNVLVDGNIVAAIDPTLKPDPGARLIDGQGGVLTPGMIDNH